MKFFLCLATALTILSTTAFAFDKEMAKKMDAMFSQFTPEVLTLRPCQVTTKDIFEMIKKKEEFIILDIRTPAETRLIAPVWKGSLIIPMHELFKAENLAKLPKDRKIVVMCHTGDRAAAAVVGLRAVGFNNAFQFRGGIIEFAREVGRAATEVVKD